MIDPPTRGLLKGMDRRCRARRRFLMRFMEVAIYMAMLYAVLELALD